MEITRGGSISFFAPSPTVLSSCGSEVSTCRVGSAATAEGVVSSGIAAAPVEGNSAWFVESIVV